jgi:hypothetical protein
MTMNQGDYTLLRPVEVTVLWERRHAAGQLMLRG